VTLPDGSTAYTRDGALKLSSEGSIVTSDGYSLEPQVTIPQDATAINVSSNGEVSVLIPGSTDIQEVGQLELARFINPAGLKSVGRNLMLETQASGSATVGPPDGEGFGKLSQGFLELSNVEVVDEMVSMIVAQRAYEINAKAIQTSEEMLSNANNLKR
jgi:flagellar basal-body rod protein FlgG